MCNGDHFQRNYPNKDVNKSAKFKVNTCFKCGERHATAMCQKNQDKNWGTAGFIRSAVESGVNEYIIPVFVNGVKCAAMRESGCAIVLVRESVLTLWTPGDG